MKPGGHELWQFPLDIITQWSSRPREEEEERERKKEEWKYLSIEDEQK